MTSVDRARFAEASRALLSLAKQPDTEQACLNALDCVLELLGLGRAAFRIPEGKRMRVIGRGFDPAVLERLETIHAGVAKGRNRYADPEVDRVMARLHDKRCQVWDFALMERLTGVPREEQELYHEVARPGGLRQHAAAAVPLPVGKAMLGVGYDDPEEGRFGQERLAVLRLLLPALETGMRARRSFAHRQAALAGVLDGLSEGIVIFDMDGGELYRNRALRELLADDPGRRMLLAAMRVSAERLVALQRGGAARTAPAGVPAPGKRTVDTDVSNYAVRASYLAPGTFVADEAVLVTLHRSLPALPSAEELRRRFGLTPRQAEVALLAAPGADQRGDRRAARAESAHHPAPPRAHLRPAGCPDPQGAGAPATGRDWSMSGS